MVQASLALGGALVFVHGEMLLFVAAFFAIGIVDECALDFSYLWLRLTGRVRTDRIDERVTPPDRALSGRVAVFIAAWQESEVIGTTLRTMLAAWPHGDLSVYVGCYRNDCATIAAVAAATRADCRVRLVITPSDGPTSKANCLNRLYEALQEDERRAGVPWRLVLLHDAEDSVDRAALGVIDRAIDTAEFVQLPVIALPQKESRWVGSHYSDEFAEAHGKVLVVRSAIGAAIPGAGVGCGVSRGALAALAEESEGKPFAETSLTEDYELGVKIARMGGRGRFLRVRTEAGRLVATRAYFPSRLDTSIRQKTRWIHGIALQGWDRLGWGGEPADLWMQVRDRRGPLAAILLMTVYLLLLFSVIAWLLETSGMIHLPPISDLLRLLLAVNLFGLIARCLARCAFTSREFGWREGLLAIPRIFVSNIVAILAGRRALVAYVGTLRGAPLTWDKTDHSDHPAKFAAAGGCP